MDVAVCCESGEGKRMRTVDVSSDDDDVYAADDTNGGDGVQQSQVSSSEPGPSILASNVIGPLLLEVRLSSALLLQLDM